MKENKLIEMQHRIAQIGEVLNEILQKITTSRCNG